MNACRLTLTSDGTGGKMGPVSVFDCDPGMMPEAVPVLPVRDLSQGIEFYLKLGFAVESEGRTQALLSRGDRMLRLDAEALGVSERAINNCFPVDCADTFQQEVAALQVVIANEGNNRPWRMREIAITDPDGNRLYFAEKFQDGVYS